MKRFIKIVILFLTIGALLTACAPAVQGLVSLPDEGRLLVLELVTAGVTFVLLKVGELLKVPGLDQFGQPLAAVLAPIIITIIENYLGLIPPMYDNVVLTIIHLIVLLVGSIGGFALFKRIGSGQAKHLLA